MPIISPNRATLVPLLGDISMQTNPLHLHLFGTPQFLYQGKPVTGFVSNKVRALLIYLAVTGRPHSRDALTELFWADTAHSARVNIRKALSNLRKLPGVVLVEEMTNTVALAPQSYRLDTAEFERHMAADDQMLDVLAWTADLYQGDFLSGFNISLSYEFEAWALAEQRRLRTQMIGLLERLIHLHAQAGKWPTAIATACRLLGIEPWHEATHCHLMTLLAQSGDRSAALAQFQQCVAALRSELNVDPAPETYELYLQIRDGKLFAPTQQRASLPPLQPRQTEQAPPAQVDNQHHSSQGPPLHNLPAPLTPLVGREEETILLGQLLVDPAVRLLTLVGPGGVGKTHLALVTAAERMRQFPDGVYWVELAAVDGVGAMLVAIAQALQLDAIDNDGLQQQVVTYLQAKAVLLLLDNFEHLLPAVELVVDLLKQLPGLTIMVTSRVRLQVQSEQLFPLIGLSFPTAEGEHAAGNDSAPTLFVQQARRLRPDFKPQPADWPAIHQICRAVQGMPLGILLAAAWVRDYIPAALAHEIDKNLDFLASDWRDVPARHQSMRAVFDHSWRLLSEREQTIFQQLAVFRGGFTPAAAQAVTGATLPELIALVDRSLVQRRLDGATAGRFGFHELIRQYAAEKLAANRSLADATAQHHAEYYVTFLEQQYADMGTERQAAALATVDPDVENIRVAWQWMVEERQTALLQRALPGFNRYCQTRRRLRICDNALRFAAEQMETPATNESRPLPWLHLLAELYRQRAFYRWMAGNEADAEQLLQHNLSLLTRLEAAGEDVIRAKAYTLRELGRVTAQHDRTKARVYFTQSLALYRAMNEPEGLIHILGFLGDLAWNMGDYQAARRWLEQGLALQKAVADPEPHASLLNLLGIVALHQGELTEAETHQRDALAITQSVGRVGRHERFHLGVTLVWAGRFAEGRALLTERIAQEDKEGLRGALAAAFIHRGEACLHLGEYTDARCDVMRGLEIANVLKAPRLLGDTLRILGQIDFVEGHDEEASNRLQKSIAALRTIDQLGSLGWSLATLGCVAHSMGDLATARQSLEEALQIAQETGAFFPLLLALPACALLYLDQEPERSLELYALATRFPLVANSCWFAEVAGRPILNAAHALPPSVVTEAQQKGYSADPWITAVALADELRQ